MSKFLVKDSWGVGSSRQCAGFPLADGFSYCTPLGCSIVKWNIQTREKVMFQAHDDLITVMLQSITKNVMTVSFCGELKLWSSELKMLASLQLPTDNVIFGSISLDGTLLSICSKGPNQMLLVYDFQTVIDSYNKHDLNIQPKWKSVAPQEPRSEKVNDRKFYDCYNAAIFKENHELLVVYQSSRNCSLILFDLEGSILKQVDISPLGDDENIMLCISQVQKNIIAVGLQRGIFAFYDVDSLQQCTIIQAHGSPQVCMWQNHVFVTVSYISGVITWWDENGKELQEFSDGPTGSNIQINSSITEKNSIWIAGIMSLHYVTLSTEESKIVKSLDLSFLSLTGCGLAINDQDIVASGDFTGKLLLWKFNTPLPVAELKSETLSQIRTLSWYKNYLLVGCLDGDLSFCNAEKPDKLTHLYSCIGGITITRVNNAQDKLVVGTTAGYVFVFEIALNAEGLLVCQLLYQSLQHQPKTLSDGNQLPMEIWSAAWSTDDDYIATSSEDQTTVVAQASSAKIVQVLTGHTTAVTSVDWKKLTNNSIILATCADDRTVRIYDGVTFTLKTVVDTKKLYGWHTLTYLTINDKTDLLVVSTQNGFLVVWDLLTYECVIKRKLHGGSIEGLTLDKNKRFMLTTGSDCVVQRFELQKF